MTGPGSCMRIWDGARVCGEGGVGQLQRPHNATGYRGGYFLLNINQHSPRACTDALDPLLRTAHPMSRSLATSCGSAASDAAVTAFAKGCRGLRRLNLRGVVGVPPPLGARGVLAVCSHCHELELLDLGEIRGLEDSALASFHDHQMEKLERVGLRTVLLTCTFLRRVR